MKELEALMIWIDAVTTSRPKISLQRDFADGSLMAQVIYHYLPKGLKAIVQPHNYPITN